MKKTILAAGGDLRQIYAAEKLSRLFQVFIAGFDNTVTVPDGVIKTDLNNPEQFRADFLLLPVSVTSDQTMLSTPLGNAGISLRKLPSFVNEGGTVFCGMTDETVKKIFTSCGLEVTDYMSREELKVLNAVPTAEGAVQTALEELPVTIFGSDVMITGFGRISKVLAGILTAMGASVTVCARKRHDLAWAEILGCRSRHISKLSECAENCDIIFNTVPELLFSKEILEHLRKDCLLIELASVPGGTDMKAAADIGIKTIRAAGLPGKTAPVTAGHIIADTIISILSERGMIND